MIKALRKQTTLHGKASGSCIILSGWWFQFFLKSFIPTWGNDPIWLIFFRWLKPPTSYDWLNIKQTELVEAKCCQFGNSLHGETGNLIPCWPCLKKATSHRRKAAKRSLKTQLHFLARVVPLRVCCWLWFLRGRFMNDGISKIFKENREYGANRDQIARSNNHCLMEND